CRRRAWLLCELGPLLDYHAGERGRLFELLELADRELIDALGGRRRAQLHRRYERSAAPEVDREESLCRHCPDFPASLAERRTAGALYVRGGRRRLASLLAAPAVAIVGSERASDYGEAVAAELARGLAAARITVLTDLAGRIGLAAAAGA